MIRSIVFIYIVSLLAVFTCQGIAIKCNQVPAEWMIRQGVSFEINGLGATVHAVDSASNQSMASFEFKLDQWVEREKVIAGVSGPNVTWYQMVAPGLTKEKMAEVFALGESFVDPLEPNRGYGNPCSSEYLQLPCGKLLGHVSVLDLDCTAEHKIDTLMGIAREYVFVQATHPVHSQFKLNMSFELLDADLQLPYTTHTGDTQIIYYRKNNLKVFYELENYPYVSREPIEYVYNPSLDSITNNASWVSSWYNFSITTTGKSHIKMEKLADNFTMAIHSLDPSNPFSVSLSMSTMWFLDGVMEINEDPSFNRSGEVETDLRSMKSFFSSTLASPQVPQFKHIFYDPVLSGLYSTLPGIPQSPTQERDIRIAAIAGGVAGGVVALVIIIIAIKMFTTPSVRNYFRPYSKRAQENRNASSEKENLAGSGSTSWKHSSMPL